MSDAVRRGQRFTEERPCPICKGWDRIPRGKGLRCSGYLGADGKYAHCSREEMAGNGLELENGGTYAHRLEGPCRCGATHGDAPIPDPPRHPVNGTPVPANGHSNGIGNGQSNAFRAVAQWEYEGGLIVTRAEDGHGRKTFWQSHRLPDGTIEKGAGNAPRTLYRVDEVRRAAPEQFVFLVEGEKCADALRARGCVATTTPGGANQWTQAAEKASVLLAKRHVVILPDHDEAGRKYAEASRATLEKVAAGLRIMDLPGLGDGEDVYDWLERGNDAEDLVKMAEAREDLVRHRITWISSTNIFAPLPPTAWLNRDLGLCPGRPSLLAAYGYSGKTIIAQAGHLALATGRPIWGHFEIGSPIRVRHFDYEQGQHATRKRYQRLALGIGIDPRELQGRLELAVFPDVYLNSEDAVDVYARETEGCGLVTLDALRGATPGEDENDSKMRACIDMLARVSEKNGTTFQLLHHAAKTKDNHKDPRMILRGSSSIFDACGSVLVLTGEQKEPRLVQQVKAPAEAEGSAAEPFFLEIQDVHVGDNPKGGVRVVHRIAEPKSKEQLELEATQAKQKKSGRPKVAFGDVRAHVLDVVRSNPGLKSANAVDARCDLGSKAAHLQSLRELQDEGRIKVVAGGFYVQG